MKQKEIKISILILVIFSFLWGSGLWATDKASTEQQKERRKKLKQKKEIAAKRRTVSPEDSIQVAAPDIPAAVDNLFLTFDCQDDSVWYATTDPVFFGAESAISGYIYDSQKATLVTNFFVAPSDGIIKYYWKVSSEPDYDFLSVYHNGAFMDAISGEVDWVQNYHYIPAGENWLMWSYSKDVSLTEGDDWGLIDKIEFRFFYKPDFNYDDEPGLLLRNYANGSNQVWHLDGAAKVGSTALPKIANTDWHFEGTGSFDYYSYTTDIVLRNYADGKNMIWSMDGTTKIGYVWLPTIPDLNWHIDAIADFDDDGDSDLLLRHYTTGLTQIWFMNNNVKTSSVMLPRIPDLDWQIEAAADFNGDGKPDLLLRHYKYGVNQIWYMDGSTKTGSRIIARIPDLNWHFEAVADLNRDGKCDIIMRNYLYGTNQVWYMDDFAKIGSAMLPRIPDTSWHIENN